MVQMELDSVNDDSFEIIDMTYDVIPADFDFTSLLPSQGSVLMIANENVNGYTFTPPMVGLLNPQSWLSIMCIECSNMVWNFNSAFTPNVIMTIVRNGGLDSSVIYGPTNNFSYNAYLSDNGNIFHLNNTVNVELNNVQYGYVLL